MVRTMTLTFGKLTDAALKDVIHKTVTIELWSVGKNVSVKITSDDIMIGDMEDWMLINHYGIVR